MPRGGRRPGAGAPKGNLNAFKHGRSSKQFQRLLDLAAGDPEALHALRNLADGADDRDQRRRDEAQDIFRRLMERVDEETRIGLAYARAKRRELGPDADLSFLDLDPPPW
jgi:hypothetical protein